MDGNSVREIVHGLKNPLSAIRLNAELLKSECSELDSGDRESLLSSCDSIVNASVRLEHIIDHFGRFMAGNE